MEVTNLTQLSSDHNPLLFLVSDSPISSFPPLRNTRINWKKFSNTIGSFFTTANPQSSNPETIDKAIMQFTHNIQAAISCYCVQITKNSYRNNIPEEIVVEIRAKNRLRRDGNVQGNQTSNVNLKEKSILSVTC